jgi:hypothetical protein
MKTHVLLMLVIGLCSFNAANACRVVLPIGTIRIIDQHGKSITNAQVYQFYSQKDSFKLRNFVSRLIVSETRVVDSSTFTVYNSSSFFYGKENAYPSEKLFLIQVPGYADVCIKSISFEREMRKDYRSIPIVEVVMYAKKLVRTESEYRVYESFFLQDEIKVIDSLRLEMKDYLKDIKANEESVPEEEMSQVSAKAFPNPVVEELHIQFTVTPRSPCKIMVHDALGKLVYEAITESAEHEILMNWYKAGTYFLTIYDQTNSPLLRQQIIKK